MRITSLPKGRSPGFEGVAHPCPRAKAAERLATAGVAAVPSLPIVPTGWCDRAEPGATDRTFDAGAACSASCRPGDLPSCRELGVVAFGSERAPERFDGLVAHGVQVLDTASALVVVVVGFPGCGPGYAHFRSVQPLSRLLLAGPFAVAFAQLPGAQRRVGGQPGQLT